ncbi:thioredoxin-disulfide reductase [Candidatus Woesebacteria bacterium RIFOXYC1_FULL_31_51]|uniref:Thioredoxin reductase n=1 Tax=Candidatus Woesebacteria bacterium GW2011_GWC2_31_9 TaxID=1618586 RepID=A0A0F9YZ30_9BACT|nr:MAG: thioredoxin reductase, thioredoxin reductase (NADPH) [Candidatus Woesebacteria bacterium GW2011_GWF1_31_35]KKP23099.1 MAG: Thioredoxin reductase [Candidatus Woesebacteria bacterium GW2011_GWC1_30_29]KKP26787.1 MAG: Thioredoxin reductase [Candidatus Woesebacteria bacterium GW2011_GWD1_31_12]KKP27362.1 MAG: Thioredoxin reductase [Candidatus Woesebacteria bacterium GW2011_GWB1_31_29]KKP31611.1 MAG: Thioredoxin reductase [Candidatus Woesebacteria bacterium GW2011_GWC2_31_9]KKP33728.1 MAG: 
MKDKIWDVAIIGSGPAGLTAGIYAVRGAASTVILGGEIWGGQLMLTSLVDNFPGFSDGIMGPSLMENMKKQALRFGAEFIPKNVTEVDFNKTPFKLTTSDSDFFAKTVIIATGAETKWLGVPREKELIGRGISSCAPCDAPFFKEKDVLVVGGGDSAMEEALVLTKFASKVTIIHRRSEFKASKAMQEKVFTNKKISVIWNTEILEVIGSTKFEGLKVKNITSNEVSEIKADGMFVAIGHTPSSEIFKGKLELDEKGYIKVHSGTKTNIPGVFVSGDVHDFTYKQAVTAAGFGCMAAMDVLNYLDGNK